MSNETDTGGQAFACQYSKYENQGGMTLLDYFAGQALAGLTDRDNDGIATVAKKTDSEYEDVAALYAYGIAAAMIAEKRRRESDDN